MKWKDTTCGGYPVRIYAEDGAGHFPIHGAVDDGRGFLSTTWNSNGRHASGLPIFGLIPITPTIDWSKQPDWVKAVARNSSGKWHRFAVTPFGQDGKWWSDDWDFVQPMHPSEYPAFDGHWADSLCVRPEGGAK